MDAQTIGFGIVLVIIFGFAIKHFFPKVFSRKEDTPKPTKAGSKAGGKVGGTGSKFKKH